MIVEIVKLLRPKHWIKNGLVVAPFLFSFAFTLHNAGLVFLALVSFCALSSTVYIINDIADRENDRHHPVKRLRPIAAGKITVPVAVMTGLILGLGGLGLLTAINFKVLTVGLIYLVMNLAYSFGLKHVAIIDVMIVSLGFVLRVIAGAYAIGVPLSHWILLCTFFVMLFVAFGKRKHEMNLLQESNKNHRRASAEYTEGFITQMLALTAGISVVFYSFYTIDPQNVARFGSEHLIYTTPIVVFGIFRYFYLLYNRNEGGDPVQVFLKDRQLFLCLALWVLSVLVIYVHGHHGF